MEAGELAAVIDRSFPLCDGAAAHAYAQTRGRIGRIILIP
jgi:NADPH2:quinone reductase